MKHNKILILEDEHDLLEILKLKLRPLSIDLGFEIQTASDGGEALMMMEENEYDLFFLDLHMEGLQGEDVIVEVRKKYSKDTPIIIFSGYDSEKNLNFAAKYDVFEFLNKPFGLSYIEPVIVKALRDIPEHIKDIKDNKYRLYRSKQ